MEPTRLPWNTGVAKPRTQDDAGGSRQHGLAAGSQSGSSAAGVERRRRKGEGALRDPPGRAPSAPPTSLAARWGAAGSARAGSERPASTCKAQWSRPSAPNCARPSFPFRPSHIPRRHRPHPSRAADRPSVTSTGPALWYKYWRRGRRLPTLSGSTLGRGVSVSPPGCRLLCSSHPSRSAALRSDEAESSPHPVRAFLFLAPLHFSSSAAAATAAQLVSVPRVFHTSSPQPMAQAALGISAQGNHIPL